MTTHANQLDIPLDGALRYPIKLIDEFPWRTDLPQTVDRRGTTNTRQMWKEPIGVVGAIVPWNFPARGDAQQARPGSGHGQHGRS